MQIKNTLKELGLNDRHASIYLASLELGTSSIQKISQKSGFARSTCEAVLKSLQEKGFVTSIKKKKTRVFSPEDPKMLVSMAKQKVKLLEESLPQFQARYFKGGVIPSVRLYQGVEGFKIVLQEILHEAKELISFGSIDDIKNAIGDYFENFIDGRIKRKIPLKTILRDSPLARERQRLGPTHLREVRIIPPEYPCSSITFIWTNKVAICSFQEGVTCLVIENQEIFKVQQGMFNLIWNTLEKK